MYIIACRKCPALDVVGQLLQYCEGMGTYGVYKHSCEYRSRDFARIVWIVDAAGELVMLTTVEATDDGENDDGEERNDDAGGKIISA